jgi:hypothetical protein
VPFVNGKWIAPRKIIRAKRQKAANGGLAATYLAMDWLNQEYEANGGDWDEIISTLRELRGEDRALRADNVPGGYNGMAKRIDFYRAKFRAH